MRCAQCQRFPCECGRSPFHRGTYPEPVRLPQVPLIGHGEVSLDGIVNVERGLLTIPRRAGFQPVILALTYSTDAAPNLSPAAHHIRVDLVCEDGAGSLTSDTAPHYTLVDEDVVYWTLISQGYNGINVPMFQGGARSYTLRCTTGPALPGNLTRAFRCYFAYRPIDSRNLPSLGMANGS